jgi:hypothetical protein
MLVSCLPILTSLESLTLEITDSSLPLPPKSEPLSTRTVLPALTRFKFTGFSSLLEDIVARIDCPKLNKLVVEFIEYDYDTSQLDHFISRAPSLQAPEIGTF